MGGTGQGDGRPSAVWRSADGITWHLVDTTLPSRTHIDSIIIAGGYLVATGTENNGPGGWVSTDGSAWTAMPDLGRTPGGRLDLVARSTKVLVTFDSAPELEYDFTWDVP